MSTRKPPRNLLTLSRIELYDHVWAQPLAAIATEFKVSVPALRTRCLEVHVPLPDDADAERIARGETPHRTPLPSPQEIRRLATPTPDANTAAAAGPHAAPAPPTQENAPETSASTPAPPPPPPTLPHTFTRESLYSLVWTHPPRQLAMHFGMSDVAIAKRCRALLIPIPPRGYWARVHAGQHPPNPGPVNEIFSIGYLGRPLQRTPAIEGVDGAFSCRPCPLLGSGQTNRP